MTTSIQIADALLAKLNTQFTGTFVGVRIWSPPVQFKEFESGDYYVTIAPLTLTREPLNRATTRETRSVQIAIRKKVDLSNNSQADAAHALAESVLAYTDRLDIGLTGVHWLSTESTVLVDYEEIPTHRIFTSVITVSYVVV